MSIEVSIANNPNWTLHEWLLFIQQQIDKYGLDAKMFIDAAYSNADLVILTTGKN